MRPPLTPWRTPWVIALLCCIALTTVPRASAQSSPSVTARWQIARTRVYLGETFPMALMIQADGIQLARNADLKGMPDAAILERSAAAELPAQRKQVGNRVIETRGYRFDVTPQRLGPIRLAPILTVDVLRRRGLMTQRSSQSIRVTPITMTVLPVPEKGKPADFSGAVGDFAFDVRLSPTELAPGDLITANIRIQGNGRFDPVRVPRFSPDGHFKVYDPELVKTESSGTRHVFRQVLIPQSTNATQVGSITFSYFDAKAGQYRSVTRGPFALRFKERRKETVDHYRPPEEEPPRDAVSAAVKRRWETSPAARAALALALYWTVAIASVLWVLVSLRGTGRRRILRRAVTGAGLLLVFLLGSVPYRATISRTLGTRHQATTARQVTGRLAPSLNALETASFPEKATVQIDEGWEDWVRVSDGERNGWIPADAVELE